MLGRSGQGRMEGRWFVREWAREGVLEGYCVGWTGQERDERGRRYGKEWTREEKRGGKKACLGVNGDVGSTARILGRECIGKRGRKGKGKEGGEGKGG